ncbi:MAG: hypothetical protein QMD09_06970 [Desulfatibacillaceae bacterium]|nr:hypothetical protein [Desulfatibacillaceae bacterium]
MKRDFFEGAETALMPQELKGALYAMYYINTAISLAGLRQSSRTPGKRTTRQGIVLIGFPRRLFEIQLKNLPYFFKDKPFMMERKISRA